jgi:hypothetical protein
MVSKLKRPHTVGENIWQLHIKGLIIRIYRELKKLNSPKINEPIKKWASELNRNFTKEEIQMANKHMKKCSPYLAIKEMQIQTTLRFHFTSVRKANISSTTNNRCWLVCREKGTLLHCWWECKLVQQLWIKIWRLLKNLNIDLPYDPAIPLLGIYPKECDTGYSRGTSTPTFIAALFTIAKLWKQPRCPKMTNALRKCGIYTQWSFTQP